MKEIIITFYNKFRNLILYGMIGTFTSFLDFCIYTLLSFCAGVYYLAANCISVIVGIATSFYLNRKYNFKVKDHIGQRFTIFLTVGVCGMALSNLILYLGNDVMHANELIVKLSSIVLVVGFQFILNKFVTFRVKQ